MNIEKKLFELQISLASLSLSCNFLKMRFSLIFKKELLFEKNLFGSAIYVELPLNSNNILDSKPLMALLLEACFPNKNPGYAYNILIISQNSFLNPT